MSDSDESDNESLNGSDSDTSVNNTPITKKISINPLNSNLGEDDNDLDDDELPDDDEEEVVEEEDEVEDELPKTKNRVGYGFDNDVNAESDYEEEEDEEDEEEEGEESSRKKSKGKQSVNLGNQNVNNSFDLNYDENEDEDDDEEDEDENYLQKFNKDINKSYINEFHPECIIHNYEEVAAMSHVVRDKNGIIIDDLHKTIPFLTKYERARILGQRAKQIECGSKPFVQVPENIVDSYIIAEFELKQKKIPFVIRRPIPGGGCEYWNLRDLEIVHF